MSEITTGQMRRLMKGSGGDNPFYTRKSLQAYLDNPHRFLDRRSIFRITVDLDSSFEAMIEAGNYRSVDRNITSENFPVKEEGTYELELEYYEFNKVVTGEEAIKFLEEAGFRPVTLSEFLAFHSAYPIWLDNFPIAVLGSCWRDSDDDLCAPYFVEDQEGRYLDLRKLNRGFIPHCYFLAVRK